jgi:hypothetical protein
MIALARSRVSDYGALIDEVQEAHEQGEPRQVDHDPE